MTIKINYVELPAHDLAQVQTFYEKAFGWTFTSYGPNYSAFQDGEMDGGFYLAPAEKKSHTDNGTY